MNSEYIMISINHRWEIFAFEYFSKKKRVLKYGGFHHHKLFNFFPGHHVRIATNWQFTVKSLRLLCPYFGHFSCIAVVYMTHNKHEEMVPI